MRTFERTELIHAVVNGSNGIEMIGKRQRHRRVVPENVFLDLVLQKKLPNHLSHDRVDGDLAAQSVGQVRHNHAHARVCFAQFEPHRSVSKDRFFDKEHASLARATRQQMLRTLVNKIPTQMREANEICRLVAVIY